MESYGTHALVREFITYCPDKVEDVLVKCCEDKKWQTEITTCLLRARVGQHPSAPASPPGGLSITLGNTAPISSVDSVHSVSPPPRQRIVRQASSSTRHYPTPLSPPSTASSTTSRSVKNEGATGEYIFLLALGDNGIQEQPVRMKTAPIRDSVIREEVVHERDLAAHLTQIDEHQVAVPSVTNPGSYLSASVYECITLTWRRHNSNKTHNTTFYVLPRSDMSADILLGSQDSGEYSAGYQPPFTAASHRQQEQMIRDYQRTLRPTAPTPPAPSFHPSSLTHDRSISATPTHHHHRQSQQMGSHATEEHIQNLTRELSQTLNFSPATTILGSRPSGLHHPQPVPIPTGHTATPRDVGQNPTNNRLRLNLVWDLTTVNVWLDTAAPGEAFYDTFQQHFGKRKVIPDRAMLKINLKCDKQCPDDQAYSLSLDEDELDADWETTVSWLEENKRDKSPHIYGQVEIEGE